MHAYIGSTMALRLVRCEREKTNYISLLSDDGGADGVPFDYVTQFSEGELRKRSFSILMM